MTVETKKPHRGKALAYTCDADREYWQERRRTYVPKKKVTVVKKPLFLHGRRFASLDNVWQFDFRETTHDISEWEMTNEHIMDTKGSLKRIQGVHAIDWCSNAGISSYLFLKHHETVTTVECQDICMTLAKTNINSMIKNGESDSNKHKFIELQCNMHKAHNEATKIDWSVYDTVRLGSASAERIYDTIKSQLTHCKTLIPGKIGTGFKQQLIADGFTLVENLKAVDYFTKD